MKFRKKPIVVEAELYLPSEPSVPVPLGLCTCIGSLPVAALDGAPHIHTLEGPLKVSPGDWIITGIKGERYPCKPDIFGETYFQMLP